jgi:UDP-N-acetyl-D-glucosamine dehydrogenase
VAASYPPGRDPNTHPSGRDLHFSRMVVGIIGLGYVGLPLAVAFAEAGHDVVGLDSDPRVVERLRRGESTVEDVPAERLAAAADRIRPTGDRGELSTCDAVVICVPTPLANHREPNLTYMLDAATSLSAVLRKGQLVVLESTTYPGTTRERLKPILEESGLAAGRDFHLAYSPERIDPGRTDHTIRTTPKVVGGLTDACRDRAAELYADICDEVVPVSTPEAAELAKLLENIFRSVNIALVNELAMLCDRMEIDVWEVIDAAATKPFGFMRFEPGPGMGGHCLPVDPFYLAFKAREHDFYTEFIELAGKVNQNQPQFCVRKIERTLNDVEKPVKGSRILLLGVAYKAGVGDMRESPALKIIRSLDELGAEVSYHDPHVPELAELGKRSAELDDELERADLVCVITAHPEVDYRRVVAEAGLVLDFRGVTRGIEAANLVRL